ncbi:MAG TPA: transporter substrate-binding domain-containing protein [Gammaproteobacteria bacterium]|nr:transporter substrate-binding domain-containing protein [Gammaproteobacteria bacterium]
MINKDIRLLVVIVFLCLFSGRVLATAPDIELSVDEKAWLLAHPHITVAFDGYFPPYSFLNNNGKPEGLAVDVFDIIGHNLGVSFDIYPEHTWKTLYAAAKRKEVDVVATMVRQPERETWFNFTDPYIFKSMLIITRVDDERISTRSDIRQKKVALVRDYQYVKPLLEEFPSITPVYVDTILDALNTVSIGKADATIAFQGAAFHLQNKYLIPNLKFAAVYDPKHSLERIAVRKDWPILARILDKALKAIPESQKQQLRDRWLPADIPGTNRKVPLTEQEKNWIRQHPTILLGIDPEFAPFEYIDNGVYSGMASDYIRLLNQRLGLNMQVVKGISWEEAMQKAKDREIDVLPVVAITEERKQYFNFTRPYIQFHRVIITQADRPFITGLDDIRGQRIAVQHDSSHEGYLADNTDIQPVGFDTLQQALLAVSNGKVDAFVGNVASATYWIRKLNLTNLKIAAPVSLDIQNLHFAVRKDWPELTGILQKGLDSISDNERRIISKKWLLLKYDPVIDYKLAGKATIALAILLLAVMLWNLMLNRKVRQRTKQLAYQAHYDQLTDLPNRFLITDRLSQLINEARRSNTRIAVLSIDLDDFKKINDTLSHSAGDRLLKEAAQRLKNTLREDVTLGRLGGDEFIVLSGHLDEPSQAASIAETLLNNFRQSFLLDGRELKLTASLGIAIFPDDGSSPEILLKNADSAMHHSKKLGRDTYAFYTSELNQQAARRLQLEEQMHGALERGEFSVHYQPKIDISSGKIVSFEALLRWHNDELGDVSPAEFIPVAESNSLIEPIGLFVIQQALDILASWQQQFDRALTMAVNLSPRQFLATDLVTDIRHALATADIASNSLELEITEGVLMSGQPGVEDILRGLNRLGVTLAMDDFGTGYSSMSYLRKYTFDILKIDREFISDLTQDQADRQLVSATIAMAHGLGMKVVAEGVETEEQLSFLAAQHCNQAQGFLFSTALPARQVSEMLAQQEATGHFASTATPQGLLTRNP